MGPRGWLGGRVRGLLTCSASRSKFVKMGMGIAIGWILAFASNRTGYEDPGFSILLAVHTYLARRVDSTLMN